eukprot:CAMPEP_0178743510 /NCGR_PEP_ID=MMETSP0744-20121128/6245_1 /TAXON_ID=913974 /ORGANISM="Nitzschia punctata, Strain CCMP561" /LENGTH=212 /DNA_ID=CAMNT_0020396521 /DNA_START=341 /DNA_END=979 /DNA_ORIENTATION=-
MNGDTWTCGYLQETVEDVRANGGAAGEARWCALAQLWAEQHCSCAGPAIPPTSDNYKDPNAACDLCEGNFQFDYVPAVNSDVTANTGVAGNMNCEGLYQAMAEGVLTGNLCPVVRQNAGPTCCNLESVQNVGGSGGGGGGSSPAPPPKPQQPQCRQPAEVCRSHSDCCTGLQCKSKTLQGPSYCTSARTRPRTSIADNVGGAAGRARRAGKH